MFLGWVLPFCNTVAAVLVLATLASGAAAERTQSSAQKPKVLRIVVIEGEDAVNIIQQRTAVAPVVEVRDDNDLPVAGILVTFSITGRKTATFARGAQTLTVTTDAAGRASATTLTPLMNGPVQVQVTTTVQGQTAVATISQTNFLTIADAVQAGRAAPGAVISGVAASGAVATGVATAGAGGLSALTIGAIAGGVGAGVLAATALGGGDEPPANPTAPPPSAPTPPTVTGVVASTALGLQAATPIQFSSNVNNPANSPLTYRWDFGDGSTSDAASPAHTYQSEGTFTVRVTVTDGRTSSNGETNISVRNVTGRWTGIGRWTPSPGSPPGGPCDPFCDVPETLELQQNGATVSVAWTVFFTHADFRCPGGAGTVSAPRQISYTLFQCLQTPGGTVHDRPGNTGTFDETLTRLQLGGKTLVRQ